MRYEFKKVLSIKFILMIFILFCISSVILFVKLNGIKNGADTRIVCEIGKELEGVTDAKGYEYIKAIYEDMEECFSKELDMQDSYISNELGRDEYLKYVAILRDYKDRQSAITKVYEDYQKAYNEGYGYYTTAYYDEYIKYELIPWSMLCIAILFNVILFAAEKKNLTALFIPTAVGASYIKKKKIIACTLFNFLIVVIFTIVDMGILFLFDGIHCIKAFLQCFKVFDHANIGLSFSGLVLVLAVTKFIVAELISIISVAIYNKAL